MNEGLVEHISAILELKDNLTAICKLEFHTEIMKIWARWIITHRSLFPQSSLYLPSDTVYDGQLIQELIDKGCPIGHAKFLHKWLQQESIRINRNFRITADTEFNGLHGNLPIEIHSDRRHLILSCKGLKTQLANSSYQKLRDRCDPELKKLQSVDSYIWLTSLIYSMLDGKGLQWAVPYKFLNYLRAKLGCNTEIFASPINCYYDNYYSLFNTDKVFGSRGNFFTSSDNSFVEGAYQINPPFIDSLFTKTTERLLRLLKKADDNGKELTFIYIMPNWSNFRTLGLVTDSCYCVKSTELRSDYHYYYQYSNNTYIRARFSTLIVFLSTNAEICSRIYDRDIIRCFQNSRRKYI